MSERVGLPTSLVRKDLKTINVSSRLSPLLVSLLKPEAMETEGFYNLRHSIENLRADEQSMTIGLTSPMHGEGKTLVAMNLAGALSRDEENRVLLVDLDLRNTEHDILSYFGLKTPKDRGVVNSIRNNDTVWENASYLISEFNLYIMPSGQDIAMPYEVLNSPVLGRLLDNARDYFDYIIIDSPSVLTLADTRLIARWISGYLMVVTSEMTQRSKLAEALDIVGPDKMLGLVFNKRY